MPFVYALALIAGAAGLFKLGALVVVARVLWLAVIALVALALALMVYTIHLRRQRR